MKKLSHKIYWNQAIRTWQAAGETYPFVYAKPACLLLKSYAPLSKRQRWFFTFIQTIDIGLRQWNRMYIIIKDFINILLAWKKH